MMLSCGLCVCAAIVPKCLCAAPSSRHIVPALTITGLHMTSQLPTLATAPKALRARICPTAGKEWCGVTRLRAVALSLIAGACPLAAVSSQSDVRGKIMYEDAVARGHADDKYCTTANPTRPPCLIVRGM